MPWVSHPSLEALERAVNSRGKCVAWIQRRVWLQGSATERHCDFPLYLLSCLQYMMSIAYKGCAKITILLFSQKVRSKLPEHLNMQWGSYCCGLRMFIPASQVVNVYSNVTILRDDGTFKKRCPRQDY